MAYRRQKITDADSAHDRTRVFNERFTAIATQLGDAQHAVRLAGVHAMAGLADDWKQNRQTCVDVLCAYLRLLYDPDRAKTLPPLTVLAGSPDARDQLRRSRQLGVPSSGGRNASSASSAMSATGWPVRVRSAVMRFSSSSLSIRPARSMFSRAVIHLQLAGR